MKFWLNDDIDMTQIVDSMQLDSDQEIAGMEMGGVTASLEVRGDVKVWWNEDGSPLDGDYYTRPSEFPQKLKDLILEDRWYDCDGSVYVSENNWFELFYALDDEFVGSDVVDVERMTPIEIFSLLYDTCMEVEKENER